MLVEHTDTVNNGPPKKKVFSPLFAASSQNTLLWDSREYQTALLYRWISFWVGQNEAVLRENTYLEVLSLTCKICQIPWWHHKGSVYKLCLKEQTFFFPPSLYDQAVQIQHFQQSFPSTKSASWLICRMFGIFSLRLHRKTVQRRQNCSEYFSSTAAEKSKRANRASAQNGKDHRWHV